MIRASLVAVVLFALLVNASRGEHPPKPTGVDPGDVPLMENLGNHEHKISTDRPLAQQYFNQGLRLIYGFNHDEAIRAFRAAAKADPNCAMAQWGIAIALGPNYNVAAEKERSAAAYVAVKEAKKLLPRANEKDAAYIEALSARYDESPDAERKPLDIAYANAMRKLAAGYPDDMDAAVLFAEAMMDLRPWELWTFDGKPQPGTEEIVATLERVLEKTPDHPGANHFYIHAVEASLQPERAMPSALRLAGLMPGAGHMVHMPSHIYFRVGRYQEAVDSNARAVEVDEAYIAKFKPEGVYAMMYYPHNIHFLWAALSMEGRSTDAIATATRVVEKLPVEMVREMPMLEAFMPTRLYALVLFRKWEEILKEKQPLPEFTLTDGMWHYARGLALVAGDQLDAAQEQLRALQAILVVTPDDKLAMRHHVSRLLAIAADELEAAIESKRGKTARAIQKLQEAVALQDGLLYDEPPAWFRSERERLGLQLLQADRPAEAELVFQEDLKRQPENGWALHGLELTVRALGRTAEADEVHKRFEKAWARADFKP